MCSSKENGNYIILYDLAVEVTWAFYIADTTLSRFNLAQIQGESPINETNVKDFVF